jgi:O-antigen/teichoic acid export membrane protein
MNLQATAGPRSLRSNFNWVLFGNILFALSQWSIFVVLTRFSTQEAVGHFALGLAISGPIFFLLGLDLRAVQATDARGDYSLGEYVGLTLALVPLGYLLVLGVVLVFDLGAAAWVVLAVALAKAIEAISLVFYGAAQQAEQMDRIARSLVLRGLTGVVALGLVLGLTDNVPAGVIGLAAAWATILLVHDIPSARNLQSPTGEPIGAVRPALRRERARSLTRLAWPAGINRAVASLSLNTPRYLVQGFLGAAQLGVFSAVGYVMRIVDLVSNALTGVVMPRLAKYYVAGRRSAFWQLLAKSTGLATGLGLLMLMGAVLVGEQALSFFYGSEYADGPLLVQLVLAGIIVTAARFLSAAILAARHIRLRTLITVATTVLVLAVGVVLIPRQGLMGAANSLLIAYGLRVIVSLAVLVRIVPRGGGGAAPIGRTAV